MAYKKAMSLLEQGQLNELVACIKLWNNSQLAEFLVTYPKSVSLLNTDFFSDFWQERRNNIRITGMPEFRFMAQEQLSDADLVVGYLLFSYSAIKPKEASGSEKQITSTDYLSFHLIFKHLHHVYKSLAGDEDLKKLAAILYNLESSAKIHGCPGFLLLANGYLQLAVRYQHSGLRNISQDAYKLCWKYLHLAELSEADSKAEINNAYFGKGLMLSNPLKLATIDEMKTNCCSLAETLLTAAIKVGAEREAEHSYQRVSEHRMRPCM